MLRLGSISLLAAFANVSCSNSAPPPPAPPIALVPGKEATFEVRIYEIDEGQLKKWRKTNGSRRVDHLFQDETGAFLAWFDEKPEFMATIGINPGETMAASNTKGSDNDSNVSTTFTIATKKQESGALDSEFYLTRQSLGEPGFNDVTSILKEIISPAKEPHFEDGAHVMGGGILPKGAVAVLMPGGEIPDLTPNSKGELKKTGNLIVVVRADYPRAKSPR